jgi:hypothetical protein
MKLSGTLPGMIEALTSDDIVEETFTWTDQDKSGALTWAEVWQKSKTDSVKVTSANTTSDPKTPGLKVKLLSSGFNSK